MKFIHFFYRYSINLYNIKINKIFTINFYFYHGKTDNVTMNSKGCRKEISEKISILRNQLQLLLQAKFWKVFEKVQDIS